MLLVFGTKRAFAAAVLPDRKPTYRVSTKSGSCHTVSDTPAPALTPHEVPARPNDVANPFASTLATSPRTAEAVIR